MCVTKKLSHFLSLFFLLSFEGDDEMPRKGSEERDKTTDVSVKPLSRPNSTQCNATQGTDEEELERAMEVSGLRDADVWAPLTGDEGFDSEEEEMGGSAVFHHDFSAGVSSPKKQRR